jgi:hypothetical protein
MTENPYLADFKIANRNRNVGNLYLDYTTPIAGLTITPTFGWQLPDRYTADPGRRKRTGPQRRSSLERRHRGGLGGQHHAVADGLVHVREHPAGAVRHVHIEHRAGLPHRLQQQHGQNINTWVAGATFQLIPDRLALKLSGTYELAQGNWKTGPGSAGCLPINAAGTSCGIVSPGNPAYPAENTTYTHFDASLTYKVDPAYLTQFGKGELYLQFKYIYECNDVTNWQTSGLAPYMDSTLNSSTVSFKDMIFMAGENPNYTAQAIMASLMVKW